MTTTVRQEFVQRQAKIVRDALAYLMDRAESYELSCGLTGPMIETVGQRDDALAALEKLEELAT